MKTRIFIEDSFDSAHFLPNMLEGHKCAPLHGHTYRVRLEVAGVVNPVTGWVIDYADAKVAWDEVKGILDHRELNQMGGLENSTCENLAAWIVNHLRLPGLASVEVRETE